MALLGAHHAAALQQLFTTSCNCISATTGPPCCASATKGPSCAITGPHAARAQQLFTTFCRCHSATMGSPCATRAQLGTLYAPLKPSMLRERNSCSQRLAGAISQLKDLHAQLGALHAARAHIAFAHVTQHRFLLDFHFCSIPNVFS